MIKKIVLSLLLIIGFLINSCADDPSSVGLNLLEQDLPKIDTINSLDGSFSQTSSYFRKVVPLGASPRLLVGKSGNLTAHTLILMGFLLPDSIKNDFKDGNLVIDKAYVELYPNYFFPASDSLASFDYTVHKILNSWSSTSFSADSFNTLQYNSEDLSSNRTFSDSIYSFELPIQFARDLVDNAIYPDSIKNYGMLISPSASSQKVVGFNGFTPLSDVDTKLRIVITKQGAYTDTLTAITGSDISVVLGDEPSVDPGFMILQSSTIYNSRLKFDLSNFPNNVTVNRATLTLYSDSTKNIFGSQFSNAVLAYVVTDSDSDKVSTSLFATISATEQKNYKGEITSIVRYWLLDQSNNLGFILRPGAEQNGLELFYLYNSEVADLTKRPYLEIIYSYN